MTNRLWPRLHLVIGIAGLVVFLLTGQYMDRWLNHLDGMADGPRALYRSAHIYILFSALLNLQLGVYMVTVQHWAVRALQYLGSILLLATPALFLYGFIVETPPAVIERPMIRESIYCALGGVLMHGVAVLCHHVGRDRPHSIS
jgi:hypothetical protein